MNTDDWANIGKDIEKHYKKYDGFVVLHGTDTRAYTACALSFMCENLEKPVILTGSQVPIYEMRNYGRDNLLGALLKAGQFVIPEFFCLVNWDTMWQANTTAKFTVNTQMNRNVGLLRLFPGITAETVRAFLQPPMERIVLEIYGSGNAPDNRADLLEEIRKASASGLIMINPSVSGAQC